MPTLVYAGEVTGSWDRARPQDVPALVEGASPDPYAACALGDVAAMRSATVADPDWVNRAGGALRLPPLVAVTHSHLAGRHSARFVAAARHLLEAGADPGQRIGSHSPPASVAAPNAAVPLSALYGAAGVNRDPALTALLLDWGANPNDGESLYHSLENPDCTKLLLQHGCRIAGTNAVYRALDLETDEALRMLLAHGGDPNEAGRGKVLAEWGAPLLWAIRRRRSPSHVGALLAAGADPLRRTVAGEGAYGLAVRYGLEEVAQMLAAAGVAEPVAAETAFAGACARGDGAAARRIQAARPDLPGSLSASALRLLPDLAQEGARDAVMLMVSLGWPIEATGGDWGASALNHAVFRGDADLTRFLLAHGADRRARHAFGDDVAGTLAWASRAQAMEGDWMGCARALLAHGMPGGVLQADGSVMLEGTARPFSTAVTAVLIGDQPGLEGGS